MLNEEIKLENRIVCFIDILGYKNIIEEFDKTMNTSIIDKIKKAYNEAISGIKFNPNPNLVGNFNITKEQVEILNKDIFFKTFSDNIIISLTYDKNTNNFLAKLNLLLIFSNGFQYSLMSQSIYTRGGVSYGSFYVDENIIFSPALVKAYKLESEVAKYPRIIIDSEITKQIFQSEKEKIISSGLGELIYFDCEHTAFLTPFSLGDSFAKEMEEFNASSNFINVKEHFEKTFENMSKEIKGIALKPHQNLLKQYDVIINDLKVKSTDNKSSEHIRNKYVWLIEFHKWKYLNEPSMLSFVMLGDVINN